MYRKISAVLAVAAAGGIAALLTTGAAAGSSAKQQRVAIVLGGGDASTFELTPMSSGPLHADSGTVDACCWTNRDVVRDGQAASIDNPKLTFKGKHGTFTWRGKVTFVDVNNDYTVATATWKITHGTGAYAHLTGHGRQAFVQKTAESQNVADKAEGVFTLPG